MIIETKRMISSGHIVDGETKCSRLHGHNWFVTVRIEAEVGKDGMVIDFLKIKDIIDQLDHKFILTRKQIVDQIETSQKMYVVFAGGRNYILPSDVCFVIDKPYSTSEYLVEYFIDEFKNILKNRFHTSKLKVTVEETPGSLSEQEAEISSGNI